jgi:hypothetical protein
MIEIITEIMNSINWVIDEVFFFLNPHLRLFALTILILNIDKVLKKKKHGLLRLLLHLSYFTYCVLRLIPIAEFSYIFLNLYDIAFIITGLLPYIMIVILGKIIMKTKYLSLFTNFHVLHLLFVITTLISYYFYPDETDIVIAMLFVAILYIWSLLTDSVKKQMINPNSIKRSLKTIHPMWFLVFFLLGYSLASFTNSEIFIYLGAIIGFLTMILVKDTPSNIAGFDKSSLQTLAIWVIEILSVVLTLLNYYGFQYKV